MKEEFLYTVWERRMYQTFDIKSTCGLALEILETGFRNIYSGPDYTCATIRINGIILSGNIELHVYSSDWDKHKHQTDPSYNSVILHVVYFEDKKIVNNLGQGIVTMELAQYISINLSLGNNQFNAIPCKDYVKRLNEKNDWLDKLFVERLNNKISEIGNEMLLAKGNLIEVFYRFFLRCFGLPANGLPFYLLSLEMPLKLVMRYINEPEILRIIIFNLSGIVWEDSSGSNKLNCCFEHYAKKHSFRPLPIGVWKRSGMRPTSMPIRRLFLLLSKIQYFNEFFNLVFAKSELHFRYETLGQYLTKDTQQGLLNSQNIRGVSMQNLLWINLFIPFIYFVDTSKDSKKLLQNITNSISELPSEQNRVTKAYSKNGFFAKNLLQSQSLLQLQKNYCSLKMCMKCEVGKVVFDSKS